MDEISEEERFSRFLEGDRAFWGDFYRHHGVTTFREAREVERKFFAEHDAE